MKIVLLTTFILSSLLAISQDYPKQFKELCSKNDTAGARKLLLRWEAANAKDPELYVGWFNYYVIIGRTEMVTIDRNQKKEGGFELTDSATGKPVGFLNSSIHYNSAIIQKGFDYIDKGIALFPTRLDMRFGKIYMLGQAENYKAFANTIVETIDYGQSIQNKWTWKEGKPLQDATNFFLGSMQDYVRTIYDTEKDELLPYMRQISEGVLKYYPQHVESLANVALTYALTGENDKALSYLLKAEKIAPKDVIVLNNIAETYKKKNDKTNAAAYYKKVIQYGNKDEVEDAKQKLKEL